ncbi:hypothetical protein ACIBEJ_35140 [Nonomuraea sp. NPDC050790]|uniref:hypothetical protein n=1 Tax=Nonomuraea sp. NPDC050790 TaxID=3364371 RepID=UPI0037B404D5
MIAFAWVLLALAALNAALGIYTVITGRAPAWGLWLKRRRRSRLSGWANLLIAAFVALLVITQNVDWSLEVEVALIVAGFMAGMGAAALQIIEAGRPAVTDREDRPRAGVPAA